MNYKVAVNAPLPPWHHQHKEDDKAMLKARKEQQSPEKVNALVKGCRLN